MAKRRRTTGLPLEKARVGEVLPRVNRYTGWQCVGCALEGTCVDTEIPGGPWEVVAAEAARAVTCKVHPTITMVPVEVLRIKEDHRPREAPRLERREEWNVLLDANALIEGAKGTFPGLLDLIMRPPPGFHYYTTEEVASEVRFLKGQDRGSIFTHIEVLPTPDPIHARIRETHGEDINPGSHADMGLFQLALTDERMHILVSHDRFHRWTGLPQTLGIAQRLKVYAVDDFVRFGRKKR